MSHPDTAADSELARLRWRCRRGMLELDLLLLPFVERGWAGLDPTAKEAFWRLLDLPDPTLLELLLGLAPPPDPLSDVVAAIRATAA